jgi:F0F1-type ATP synthase beta subunit
MPKSIATCLLSVIAVLLLAMPLAAGAERGERAVERQQEVRVPVRGMTMDNVIDVFGEPRRRVDAVGDPPISRWEYEGFTVYFEYRWVLHSVVHS